MKKDTLEKRIANMEVDKYIEIPARQRHSAATTIGWIADYSDNKYFTKTLEMPHGLIARVYRYV